MQNYEPTCKHRDRKRDYTYVKRGNEATGLTSKIAGTNVPELGDAAVPLVESFY